MPESLGSRIAAHRTRLGWTQNGLAARIGISRTALSHLEAGMSVPGERTITLLAGVFGCEPHELVGGTEYPAAKAERLPVVAARYTEVEHQLALLELDLRWIDHTLPRAAPELLAAWRARLGDLLERSHDGRERAALTAALDDLRRRSAG